MKRVILLVLVTYAAILLCSCGYNAKPIENPEIDKFEEYYIGDNFTVLKRSEIDPEMLYAMIAYGFGLGTENDTCNVGEYERYNYMFFYRENYYDIVEFNKFHIVSCDDLFEMNVKEE
jgi:hypothetical protein